MAKYTKDVFFEIFDDGHGNLQLSISAVDENDSGHGYRIFGTKFIGQGKLLRRHRVTERDVEEIRSYLDLVKSTEEVSADG